jgi:hypothetical protein
VQHAQQSGVDVFQCHVDESNQVLLTRSLLISEEIRWSSVMGSSVVGVDVTQSGGDNPKRLVAG